MANMVITNATTGPLTISGDKGIPRLKLVVGGTATVAMGTVTGNIQFCNELAAYITAGSASAVVGSTTMTAARVEAYRDGDMSGVVYDVDGDGVVDTSAAGAAHAASDGSSHTFIDQSVVSGALPVFAVTNMTGTAAGLDSDATAHAAADGSSHTFIDQDVTNASSPIFAVTNMTGTAAGLDSDATAHAAADGSSHTFIDQDVTNASSPIFAVTNMTGTAAGLDSDATAHAAADGSSHTFIDQDVTNASSPIFAVTNMTGTAAGLDSDATAHAAADGSSHTFIDQDVTNASSPIFAVTNMTGTAAGLDSDATAHAAADGSSHTFIDQDVTNASSPIFAVTNMTGTAAGLDSDATTHIATTTGNPHAVARTDMDMRRVAVSALAIDTLNDEQSTALGGAAGNQWVPTKAILHMEAVVGAAANGDTQITIGTSAGGTQILGATALTNLISLNDHFVIDLSGLTATILANATIYVKVTTADTTAGAGHLADAYIVGEEFVSGT